jgi:serine/threonine protein kinase
MVKLYLRLALRSINHDDQIHDRNESRLEPLITRLHSFGFIPICQKPGNLNLDEHNRVQIADFGQNRLDSRESGSTVRGAALEFMTYEMSA